MLTIRKDQLDAFQQASLASFEREMVAHSKEFSPEICHAVGDEQVRSAVSNAGTRARGYGFTNRGPIRLFLEMTILLGHGFDSDPQYPWAANILRSNEDQMQRAEALYNKIIEYQEISPPDGAPAEKALQSLLNLREQALPFSSHDFSTGMVPEIERVFPEKAHYIGEQALVALIRESGSAARKYSLPALSADIVMLALMFTFGHNCAQDPLHPWIARILNDPMADAATRVDRLVEQSSIWLRRLMSGTLEKAHE